MSTNAKAKSVPPLAAPRTRRLLAELAPPRAVEVMGPDVLRTPRMMIRPLRESDRAAFIVAAAASRAEVTRWVDLWPTPGDDQAAFDRQLQLLAKAEASGRGWRRAGFLADGRLAGCFNLSDITTGLERKAQASWWVSTSLSGEGLGREGVEAMLTYALASLPAGLGLLEIFASVHEENTAGNRLCRSVGMEPAAEVTATVLLGGRWIPHRVYVRRAAILPGGPARPPRPVV